MDRGNGLKRSAHFVNFTQDGTESRRECVALFGEQRVPGLRTLETSLVFVSAIRVGNIASRGPVPDMMTAVCADSTREESN